jgi:hypothetical protein
VIKLLSQNYPTDAPVVHLYDGQIVILDLALLVNQERSVRYTRPYSTHGVNYVPFIVRSFISDDSGSILSMNHVDTDSDRSSRVLIEIKRVRVITTMISYTY